MSGRGERRGGWAAAGRRALAGATALAALQGAVEAQFLMLIPPGWHRLSIQTIVGYEYDHFVLPPLREELVIAYATFDELEGVAMAKDATPLSEALAVGTTAGYLREEWKYFPGPDGHTGEVELLYHLLVPNGFVDLMNADCLGEVRCTVAFWTDLGGHGEGATRVVFGRSTTSKKFGGGSYGGMDVDVLFGQGEGYYPMRAVPPKHRGVHDCTERYAYEHRTSVYAEAWADGWFAGFYDYGAARCQINGEMWSDHDRRKCPH